ncbi:hypothetical protein [Christiangramia oceanisediminis]|uniref:hypothetical protein n=1 Tax=Christiangramia oceanisediminis TaxID=2920386 RepID=UPI003133AB20
MKNVFTLLLAAMFFAACSSNPYSKTNRLHKKQVKQYAKELKEFPVEDNGFQNPLNYGPYEVGTTNFNLRKPNFVVIGFGATNPNYFYHSQDAGELSLCDW